MGLRKRDEIRAKEILKEIPYLKILDLIALGNILGIEEKDNFEDFVTDIIDGILRKSRKEQVQFVKLLKDLKKANAEIDSCRPAQNTLGQEEKKE